MQDKLRKRLAGEESGFTLIELLVVIIILGILLATRA
jgi:prepilin-type N-terminal cleavage/methylation domain-containing protein